MLATAILSIDLGFLDKFSAFWPAYYLYTLIMPPNFSVPNALNIITTNKYSIIILLHEAGNHVKFNVPEFVGDIWYIKSSIMRTSDFLLGVNSEYSYECFH